MRFDAYCATLPGADFGGVIGQLADGLGGMDEEFRPVRRYRHTRAIKVAGDVAAWVGVDGASGAIYVEGKGDRSPMLAGLIRQHYPDHTVPRADVCEDYDEPGAFSALVELVRQHKGSRVRSGYKELPDNEDEGKTWAAGQRGGVGFVRVYEAGKHPDRVHLERPDWARLELECRPQYAKGKRAAASMSPVEFWGATAWTHRVGEAAAGIQIERFEPELREYSFDKTTAYLARTFRRHFETMIADGLHIEATLREVWREDDRRGRRR